MFRAFSQAETAGVEFQQDVSTSSPPRWMKLSAKTPGEGLPGLEATPPVHSPIRSSITAKVSLLATFSGCGHSALGQISG